MAIVTQIKQAESFGKDKPFAVVRFRKGGNGTSKFAVGSLNDGNSYSLTYNLQLIYPDIVDDEGNFKAKAAYKEFEKEMPVGSEEPVNCFDIPISEISEHEGVIVVATKRVMQVMRPACYGDKDDALRIAKASLKRQIDAKTFKWWDGENVEKDEEDDEEE